jgi:uncharacterized membrane protein (DUF373 family)
MNHFRKAVDILIKMMIPLVIIALMMGIARIVLDLRVVFTSLTISAGFDLMVTNILSMFVIIELLKSIIEYFELHRLRITFITDAAIVFVLREVMIGLYKHSLTPPGRHCPGRADIDYRRPEDACHRIFARTDKGSLEYEQTVF